MSEPWLRFPIACPQCGVEVLFTIPVETVAAALLKGSPVELHVDCHDLCWSADNVQLQQLREYLASVEGINLQHISPRQALPRVITR